MKSSFEFICNAERRWGPDGRFPRLGRSQNAKPTITEILKIMDKITPYKIIIVLTHSLIVWALCGATIVIGRSVMSMELILIIHAVGAPIFAALVSLFYYRKYNYTTPL